MAIDQLESYNNAEKTVEKARAARLFVAHLAICIIGNIFLGNWNSSTHYVNGNELLWFPIPLVFYGVSGS